MKLIIFYCREINTYLNVQRLIYDPIGRPRIARSTAFPARADWVILKRSERPPDGVNAGDYHTMLEQQRESGIQKLAEDFALVSTRRSTRVVADR